MIDTKKQLLSSIIFLNVMFSTDARIIQSGSGNAIIGVTTITSPGIYRVAQDINNTSDAISITIDADSVELDLEGHVISGSSTPGQNDIAISTNGHRDIIIKNGTISETVQTGILLDNAINVKLENISFSNNPIAVLMRTSTSLVIENCQFLDNNSQPGDNQIFTCEDSEEIVLKDCSFIQNISERIILFDGCSQITLKNIALIDNTSNAQLTAVMIDTCTSILIENVTSARNTVPGSNTQSSIGFDCLNSSDINLSNVLVGESRVTNFAGFIGFNFLNCNACILNSCMVAGNNTNNSVGPGDHAGFIFDTCINCILENCVAKGNSFGDDGVQLLGFFSFLSSNNITCNNIIVLGNTATMANGYNGIYITDPQSININNATVFGNTNNNGSFIGINILGNTAVPQIGITLLNALVKTNFSSEDCTGIQISGNTTTNTIRQCIISNNEANGTSYGIRIDSSTGNTILQNQIEDHDINIDLTASDVLPEATYDRTSGAITPSTSGALAYDDLVVIN